MNFPVKQLIQWFLENRRSLPWREDATPYRVWISEVMLQQTQVAVVIPYFERWMEQFPTIEVLAQIPLEKVIKLWEGLGYYSRARHIHAAAQMIVDSFKGEIPSNVQDLMKIKGLGPYTIGAIRSFAFHQKAAAVDGNVIRVLARYFKIEEEIDSPQTVKKIRKLTEDLLPEETPWLVMEGLIELGATICKKDPLCSQCPLRSFCMAYRLGVQTQLPRKKKKQQITILRRLVGVITCEEKVLLRKGKKGQIMSDLYEFPYIDITEEIGAVDKITDLFSTLLNREVSYRSSLAKQKHGFTRYQAHLFPHSLTVSTCEKEEIWVPQKELTQFPFSSGHRRILNTLV